MKNLKAKLSMLVSISLLGAMLVAPCAKAETDAEPAIQWATLYEQDFSESGLTLEKLTADGWSFSGETEVKAGEYLKLGKVDNDSIKGDAIFGKDLGGTYKITLTATNGGYNKYYLKFGGTIGTNGLTGTTNVNVGTEKVEFGTQSEKGTWGANGQKANVTVEVVKGVANLKISRGELADGTITGVTVPSSGYFGMSTDYTWGDKYYNIKIEVPADYVEYKTTYTKTATTTQEYTNQGWIYGGLNQNGVVEEDTTVEIADNENYALRVYGCKTAYIIYNKNLGTDYIVDTKICTFYNGADMYFNATFDKNNKPVSGFKLNISSDGKTYTLYKVGTPYTELNSNKTDTASEISGSVFEVQITYKNGKIDIKGTNGASLTYDATNLVAEEPALASGVTGQWCTDKNKTTLRNFTVKQASTENELGALCANYAASDTAKTVTYSVKARNNGSTVLADAKVIVAAYGADGALVGIDVPNYTGKLGQESISHSFGVTSAPAKVKAFFFDSFENIKPLTNALEETLTAE